MINHELNIVRASEFYHQGMNQLNGRILDESSAKEALLAGYLTGNNVVLVGNPGGGKTTLSSEAHHLVSDIADENVARVPHHSDLTPNQLIGGSITTTKTIEAEDGIRTETQTSQIEPIIHRDTQLIWLDELSRVNPFAVNAVLGALETGTVTTDAGEVTLHGLELAISTMNPSETRQATFQIADATASRHAIGVVMGDGRSGDAAQEMVVDRILEGWEPQNINPVITTKELHELRADAKRVILPDNIKLLARDLVMRTVDVLDQHNFSEARPRLAKHIGSTARGLALMRGEVRLSEKELRDAARYTIGARLGIKGVRGASNLYSAVDQAVDSVVR